MKLIEKPSAKERRGYLMSMYMNIRCDSCGKQIHQEEVEKDEYAIYCIECRNKIQFKIEQLEVRIEELERRLTDQTCP